MSASQASTRAQFSYAQARDILEQGSASAHSALAARRDVAVEVLYFLAESPLPGVRAVVAANPTTPIQADSLLVADGHEEVRAELARKIGRLLPGMAEGERVQLREQSIAILEALAADQAPRVRAMLAEEIKSNPRAPKHLVRQLADDPELRVCGPILEYSPLLSDVDLKEIIAATRVKGAMESIARRASVSSGVADALVRTQDAAAVAALLGNPNAQIREDTLDAILDGAPTMETWHAPLVLRANLSIRAMRRIAGFVAAALVDRMIAVQAVDDDLADELLIAVRQRINATPFDAADAAQAEEEAHAAVNAGRFNDAWAQDALNANARAKLTAALGFAAELDVRTSKKIIAARNGRAVTALCWKAGLSARTAYDVQQKLANVPPAQLVTPKGGKDYAIDASEMEWLIGTFAD